MVVFGAYSTWTWDLTAAAKDETYCDYTCFMFAFVLLILRWVRPSISFKDKDKDKACFMFAFILIILSWVRPSISYNPKHYNLIFLFFSRSCLFEIYIYLPLKSIFSFSDHDAIRHLLRLHEVDVQGLPQGRRPGQLGLQRLIKASTLLRSPLRLVWQAT